MKQQQLKCKAKAFPYVSFYILQDKPSAHPQMGLPLSITTVNTNFFIYAIMFTSNKKPFLRKKRFFNVTMPPKLKNPQPLNPKLSTHKLLTLKLHFFIYCVYDDFLL